MKPLYRAKCFSLCFSIVTYHFAVKLKEIRRPICMLVKIPRHLIAAIYQQTDQKVLFRLQNILSTCLKIVIALIRLTATSRLYLIDGRILYISNFNMYLLKISKRLKQINAYKLFRCIRSTSFLTNNRKFMCNYHRLSGSHKRTPKKLRFYGDS